MSHRHRLYSALLALTTLGWSAAALAESDEVKASAKAVPGATTQAQPFKAGERASAPAAQQTVKPPLTAEEKALLAIEEEGRQEVLELVKSLEGMPDGPARRALERKAVQLKRDHYVRLLRAKVDFARARGDFAAVQQGEAIISSILNPRPAASATVARPAPDQARVKEGGRP